MIDKIAHDILSISIHKYDHVALTAPLSKIEIENVLKQLKYSASEIDDISTGLHY